MMIEEEKKNYKESSFNTIDIFIIADLEISSRFFKQKYLGYIYIFLNNSNVVTFRRCNLTRRTRWLASLWSRSAETRVNILIRGGVRAWTFPGPWRVQRERVSRSVMFVTLISCCFLTSLSQRWPTLSSIFYLKMSTE